MSKAIENRVLPSELSDLNLDKTHLRKGHRIFRRDREPFGIPIRTLPTFEEYELSTGIEKNLGRRLVYVDPSKTAAAP